MERLVLVHGSVVGGRATWAAQRRGLRDVVELIVLERPGFPPGPPVERVDFAEHADWVAERIRPGDHLVGHSYGGVIGLLVAARCDGLASLTVLEPPCTQVAAEDAAAARFAEEGRRWWAEGPRDDPEAFLRGFLRYVGSEFDPPSPLPRELAQGAQALVRERGPWEAEIPLAALAARSLPTLVVSGAHHAGFDAICDALESALSAERLVLPGFGHNPQRHPAFNERLLAFVARNGRSEHQAHE